MGIAKIRLSTLRPLVGSPVNSETSEVPALYLSPLGSAETYCRRQASRIGDRDETWIAVRLEQRHEEPKTPVFCVCSDLRKKGKKNNGNDPLQGLSHGR